MTAQDLAGANLKPSQCYCRQYSPTPVPRHLRLLPEPDLGPVRRHPLVQHRDQRGHHLHLHAHLPTHVGAHISQHFGDITERILQQREQHGSVSRGWPTEPDS